MNEDVFDSISPVPIPRRKDFYTQKDFVAAILLTRRWKNLLFRIIILCLLLLQALFWFVKSGLITLCRGTDIGESAVLMKESQPVGNFQQGISVQKQVTDLKTESAPEGHNANALFGFEITFRHVILAANITNTILILSSLLYCFLIFFGLGASFGGKLGGLGHISRACVYSLIILILLLPWQIVFGFSVLGTVYTPRELAAWCAGDIAHTFGIVLLYLRFVGYSMLVLILLLLAHIRTFLWGKAIIRNLEQEKQ